MGQKRYYNNNTNPNALPKITLVRFQNENEDLNKCESVPKEKVVANDEDESRKNFATIEIDAIKFDKKRLLVCRMLTDTFAV